MRFQKMAPSMRAKVMAASLMGKHVAIVATDGFEQSELTQPLDALRAAGARVDVISPKDGAIQGMQHDEKGDRIKVDRTLGTVKPEEYDALVLPGGVANPDTLDKVVNCRSCGHERRYGAHHASFPPALWPGVRAGQPRPALG
jgi:hypothetical protein